MLVALVDVAAAGVGLPDLHELMTDRVAVAVHDPPGDLHPLADRLTAVLQGEVGLAGLDLVLPEHRRPELDPLGIGLVRALGGVSQQAGPIRRVVEPRLASSRPDAAYSRVIAAISSLTARWDAAAESEDDSELMPGPTGMRRTHH